MSLSRDRVYPPLVQQLRDAYFDRVPSAFRTIIRDEFCEYFRMKTSYFHHKLTGHRRALPAKLEIEWMEQVDIMATVAKREAKLSETV